MVNRVYSDNDVAYRIFWDCVTQLAPRGWAGSNGSGVVFRVHPKYADQVYELLKITIKEHEGDFEWKVYRPEFVHFSVKPKLQDDEDRRLRELGKVGLLTDEVMENLNNRIPNFKERAAQDLIKLADELYAQYFKNPHERNWDDDKEGMEESMRKYVPKDYEPK